MFTHNLDPIIAEFGFISLRWYSLAYIIGIILGWYFAKNFFTEKKIREKFDDYVTYLIIGLIVGGRLGYVVFYNSEYFINNFGNAKAFVHFNMEFGGNMCKFG